MKNITKLILIFLLISCNDSDSTKKKSNLVTHTSISSESENILTNPEPTSVIKNPEKKIDTPIKSKIDTVLLMNVSSEILKYIKEKNYKKFALFIHPKDSIRFSPYAYVDTVDNLSLSFEQFIQLVKQNKAIDWNSAWDPDMDPEIFTVDQYFKKYVYDVDFLNAELKSINDYHSQGTDLNNINQIYSDCTVVEFFFSGFEEKYEGMDFRALHLVFKMENNKPFLVGIVHDEWTP